VSVVSASRKRLHVTLAIAIALLAFASSVAALAVLWTPHASLGFAVAGRTVTAVAPLSAAARDGIRAGDALAPDTPAGIRLRALWYDAYRPGQTERLAFDRGGVRTTVTLRATAHASPFRGLSGTLVVIRVLLYALFIFVGAALVVLRPARFTWAFFFCCIGLATVPGFIGWSFTVLDPLAGSIAYAGALCLGAIASVAFLAFALRFPSDELRGWRVAVSRALPLWLGVLLAFQAWVTVAWYRGAGVPDWAVSANDVLGFLAWIVGTAALLATYRASERPERRRLQWAIAGSSAGYLAWYAAALLSHLGFGIAGRFVAIATVAMPLAVAYAVLRHRVIDFRFVLGRALVYGILASLLVAVFALSSWLTAALLLRGHLQLAVQVVFAVIVGASLQRLYGRLQRGLERAIFKRLRDAEAALGRADVALTAATSREAVLAVTSDAPVAAFDLEYAATYRRGGADYVLARVWPSGAPAPARIGAHDAIVQLLARNPAALALPNGALALAVGGGGGALVTYGPHRSGFAADPDEIALLEAFARRAGAAYDALAASAGHAFELARLLRPPEAFPDPEFASALADYLTAALPADTHRVLCACAVIPGATAADVAFVTDDPFASARIGELAGAGFVQRSADGRLGAHPLLAPALVRAAGRDARETIVRCAVRCAGAGEHLRAAELFAAAADRQGALGALAAAARANETDDAALRASLERAFATAPAAELAAYPDLLLARAAHDGGYVDDARLRAAARLALERSPQAGDARDRLAAWLAFSCAETGAIAEAGALIEACDAPGAALVRAIVAAKAGDLARCDAELESAHGGGAASGDGLPCVDRVRALYVAAQCGRWDDARALMDAALARESTSDAREACAADAAFIAWLAGADDVVLASGDALERAYPRFVAQRRLYDAAAAADRVEAQLLARLALDAATTASEPFLATLALVALFEIGSRKDVADLARAAAIAQRGASEPLRDAIAALVAGFGDCGMLQPFVRRMRAVRADEAVIAIETATAVVRRGTEALIVPERELALLLALAEDPRPHPTATLTDALWPGLDEAGGARALQTCVYRARLRLGEPRAIASVAQGYRLGAGIAVDVLEAERALAEIGRDGCADPFVRLRLEAMARHFGAVRPAVTLGWEWYDRVERRNAAVAREARRRLAEHHLGTGDTRAALSIARAMLAVDEFDEGAREIAIRVHLAARDTAEAWRELRLHRSALAREFHEEVPSALSALLPPDDPRAGGERAVSDAAEGA
jgi:DNA-binding SARP family transcriptional activator